MRKIPRLGDEGQEFHCGNVSCGELPLVDFGDLFGIYWLREMLDWEREMIVATRSIAES